VVNLDDIIEYTANTTVVHNDDHGTDAQTEESTDTLLAPMAGRVSAGTSPGDIQNVLAAKQLPNGKGRSVKVHEASTAPDTLSLGDTTYYLNKGEAITFQGCRYSTHATMVYYRVGMHECTTMYKALVDRGANGGICGEYMPVVEGSERFVDVSGLAGH
jgi:hypothetical protein